MNLKKVGILTSLATVAALTSSRTLPARPQVQYGMCERCKYVNPFDETQVSSSFTKLDRIESKSDDVSDEIPTIKNKNSPGVSNTTLYPTIKDSIQQPELDSENLAIDNTKHATAQDNEDQGSLFKMFIRKGALVFTIILNCFYVRGPEPLYFAMAFMVLLNIIATLSRSPKLRKIYTNTVPLYCSLSVLYVFANTIIEFLTVHTPFMGKMLRSVAIGLTFAFTPMIVTFFTGDYISPEGDTVLAQIILGAACIGFGFTYDIGSLFLGKIFSSDESQLPISEGENLQSRAWSYLIAPIVSKAASWLGDATRVTHLYNALVALLGFLSCSIFAFILFIVAMYVYRAIYALLRSVEDDD